MTPTANGFSPWLKPLAARRSASARLVCFPCAGAASSFYAPWIDHMPDTTEVWAVQPPGRENRIHEALPTSLPELIHGISGALAALVDDGLPTFLLGHSFGALLAFEVTHEMRQLGRPLPRHLFASGHCAPHIRHGRGAIHELPDRELIEELRHYEGTSEHILAHTELMQVLLPIIRADLALDFAYDCPARPALPVKITTLGADHDCVAPVETILAWRQHTAHAFTMHIYPGRHFFIQRHLAEIARVVSSTIAEAVAAPSRTDFKLFGEALYESA